MGVTVDRNFVPLTDIKLLTVEDFGKVGRLAREAIITRTQRGTDMHGSSFKPYSTGYAKAKAAIGASATPNLTLSGEMLRAITVEPDAEGVTLKFSS